MMAAVERRHVDVSEDDSEPQFEEESGQSESEGENELDGSDGEEGEGGSGGDEAEDEDGGEEEEDGEKAEDEDEDGNTNAGWAEAMAKILGKKAPDSSKSVILVKNKELEKVKEKEKQEQLERKKQVDKRQAWEMLSRVKPDIAKDRESERAMQRIATRGVVQLFNAVRKHQKTVDEKVKEVGGSERKKAKILSSVSKKDFIDVLRRTEGGGGGPTKPVRLEAAADEKPAWSVLRDDFMMGATMKDWDKDSDGEEAGAPAGGGGGDADESDSD